MGCRTIILAATGKYANRSVNLWSLATKLLSSDFLQVLCEQLNVLADCLDVQADLSHGSKLLPF